MKRRAIFLPLGLLVMALVVAGCSGAAEQPTEEPEPAVMEEKMDEEMMEEEAEMGDESAEAMMDEGEAMNESTEEPMEESAAETGDEEMMESEASILIPRTDWVGRSRPGLGL
ncbi:MAG: hypothetical protein WA996_04010 [Candidatus Promineifilaceae bacterium]